MVLLLKYISKCQIICFPLSSHTRTHIYVSLTVLTLLKYFFEAELLELCKHLQHQISPLKYSYVEPEMKLNKQFQNEISILNYK